MDFTTLPTLPEAQIIQRHQVGRYFDWMRSGSYRPAKEPWCVAEGDRVIDGHLRLAWERLPCAGLLVTGSLDVKGSIVVLWGGPKLVVLRDLRAWAMYSNAGEIAVAGTARFADIAVAQYPKGHVHFARLEVPVMVNDDASVSLGGGRYGYFNSRAASYGSTLHPTADYRCWSQFLDPALEVSVDDPDAEDCVERNESVEGDKALLPRMLAGISVLKPSILRTLPARDD
jgi:hypothetical protein